MAPGTRNWGKDSLLDKWHWENWTPTRRKMKLGPYLTQLTTITQKWVRGLSGRPGTTELPEENTREKNLTCVLTMVFFGSDTKTQQQKQKQTK